MPALAGAAEFSDLDQPWSVTLGAGYFVPGIEGWENQYGEKGGWGPVLGAHYQVLPYFALAAEVTRFSAGSFAQTAAPPFRVSGDRQRLVLWPVTVSVESKLRFFDTQFLVPFFSAGYRRVVYRLAVDGKDSVRGGAGGWKAGGGLDVLLNSLDPKAASGLREDYGVARSYLRLEAQWARIQAPGTSGEDVDLGGTTFLAGLRFEF